jgi:phenylacetate-coenzyme A ligase PaaK-like adenylate-forming protein
MSQSFGRLIVDLLRRPWSELGPNHYFDEYMASQWLSSNALHGLQMAKLRRLVWHCVLEVPALRATISEKLTPSAIEKLDDITRLPIAAPNGVQTQTEARPVDMRREVNARRAALLRRSTTWAQGAAKPEVLPSGVSTYKFWFNPSRCVLAAPCSQSGEAKHIHADHLIVECVGDDGAPVKAGTEGRLLLTDLHDFEYPMVRGDLGVRGSLRAAPCPCGRLLPLVELVQPPSTTS